MYTREQIISTLATKVVSRVPTFPAYLQQTLDPGTLTEEDFFLINDPDPNVTNAIFSIVVTNSAQIFLNTIRDNKFRVASEIDGELLLKALDDALISLDKTNTDIVAEIKRTLKDVPDSFFDQNFVNNI
jgi:hypothetical protein